MTGVQRLRRPHVSPPGRTVTLIGMSSRAVSFGSAAMDQPWGVDVSGGSVERGNLTPDREALIYFGSPLGRAEPMPSWSKAVPTGPAMPSGTVVRLMAGGVTNKEIADAFG